MHKIGSIFLQNLLELDNGGYCGKATVDPDGEKYLFKEFRKKKLMTLLGEIQVKRAYYYNKKSSKGFFPKDVSLGIEGTSFSLGVQRIMCRVGALRPFGLGHEDIKELAGIDISSKEIERISYEIGDDVERYLTNDSEQEKMASLLPQKPVKTLYALMDGTGIPVVKKETENRKGKGKNGVSKTREVKLGCIFTQTSLDKEGYPIRDEGSTSYVSAIEKAEDFEGRIYNEALARGMDRAKRVCVIGDGAQWIWNIADYFFHGAIQIIDVYHAREHIWGISRKMFPDDEKKMKRWANIRCKELDDGAVEKVVAAMKRVKLKNSDVGDERDTQVNYFKKNKERMRYKIFRNMGLFIGSGVAEAACKNVIGQRLKLSGMHWTVNNANKIITLRCCIKSNKWEDYWEYRSLRKAS